MLNQLQCHLHQLLERLPNHASAALVAAAPLNVEIAVPVEAVPNVVAIAIAAEGPKAATPAPATTPLPAPPAVF